VLPSQQLKRNICSRLIPVMGKAVKIKQNEQFGKIHRRRDNPQFLPSKPNFGSSVFIDKANLIAEIVGNTLQ
jgi:hypothetical protein